MEQLEVYTAHKLLNSKVWKEWSDKKIVRFQLFQKYSCVPFDKFIKALSNIMGVAEWKTKDFCAEGLPALRKRFLKKTKTETPTLRDFKKVLPKKLYKRLHKGIKTQEDETNKTEFKRTRTKKTEVEFKRTNIQKKKAEFKRTKKQKTIQRTLF